mmetsp:Transcript_28591/g.65869  ORF Transcript_28591/g.65869 Transcript_28591/m.65869 type:complete len:98 (+) Transcript_28591:693-986(+)
MREAQRKVAQERAGMRTEVVSQTQERAASATASSSHPMPPQSQGAVSVHAVAARPGYTMAWRCPHCQYGCLQQVHPVQFMCLLCGYLMVMSNVLQAW